MKKAFYYFITVLLCLFSSPAWADQGEFEAASPSFRTSMFTVESGERSLDDSLDHLYGRIDRGFSSEKQSYESEHHKPQGPLERYDDQN